MVIHGLQKLPKDIDSGEVGTKEPKITVYSNLLRLTNVKKSVTSTMSSTTESGTDGSQSQGQLDDDDEGQQTGKDNNNKGHHHKELDVSCHTQKGVSSNERSVTSWEDGLGSSVSGNLNPIFIPSIINHIASFLSCGDLKRCRLLNKQWKEECSKFLRQKGLVRLTSATTLTSFLDEFQNKPKYCENFYFEILNGIDSVTKKFLFSFGPSIKYFKLDFSTNGYHLSADEFYDLIFKYLPNLQELSLVGRISGNDHFLPEGIRKMSNNNNDNFTLSSSSSSLSSNYKSSASRSPDGGKNDMPPPPIPTLPKLESLEIFLYSTAGKNISKHQFLIELLSCVPNLKKISVPKVPRMLSFGMPLLHTLITTDHLHFHQLEHLNMDIALYNGSIDILKSKGYPLKYLNAEVNSSVSEDSLHSLLATYGKTLLSLQLKFPRLLPVASSEFSSASNFHVLRHLTLHGYKGSLQFLSKLEHLQSFGLIDNSFTIAMNREDLVEPLRARFNYEMIWTYFAEEPYSFDCFNSSDAQLLRIFSNNFLNLGSLNLPHLNDNDMRIIYKTFSHSLQELIMENSLFSDYGLTGISHGIFSDLEEMGKVDEYRTQPFIGSLKRLRRLEILTPSIELTDASIKYGIVYCENLKVCIIRNAPITDIGLRKLVDSMYLEHLETTMCANIRGSGVKYALDKMNKREMTFVWNKYQSRFTACCTERFLNGTAPVTCISP